MSNSSGSWLTSHQVWSLAFFLVKKKLIELLGRYQQHIIYFCSFKQLSRFDQRRAFRADTAALFKGCQPQLVTLILARQRCKAGFLIVFRKTQSILNPRNWPNSRIFPKLKPNFFLNSSFREN